MHHHFRLRVPGTGSLNLFRLQPIMDMAVTVPQLQVAAGAASNITPQVAVRHEQNRPVRRLAATTCRALEDVQQKSLSALTAADELHVGDHDAARQLLFSVRVPPQA